MTEQGSQSASGSRVQRVVHRDAPLASLFRRHTHLYSTRTAEAFAATLQESGEDVLLWLLRFPLSAGSSEDRRFVNRIEQMAQFFAPGEIHSCGVDDKGLAFVALRMSPYDPIIKLAMPISQRLIAWKSIVELVARLHQLGICLGDISEDSFVWHPDHGVQLLGVMGTFDAVGSSTAMLPPQSTLRYLAPEQRGVFVSEPVFDVYALGVYGYRLFTNAYPYAEQSFGQGTDAAVHRVPVEAVVLQPGLPEWVDTILGICLHTDPDKRFYSAPELLEAIDSKGASVDTRRRLSIWAKQTAQIAGRVVEAARVENTFVKVRGWEDEAPTPERTNPTVETPLYQEGLLDRLGRRTPAILERMLASPAQLRLLWAGAALLGVGLALGLFWLLSFLGSGNIEPYSEAHRSYVPPELEAPLAVISDRQRTEEERTSAVRRLAGIENQFVFPILSTLIQGANDEPIRAAALQALAANIRRSGLPQVAKVFEETLPVESMRANTNDRVNPFLSLVRSSDAMQPMEARLTALERVGRDFPQEAIAVAAALAIDIGGEEQVALLRRLLMSDSGTLCRTAELCQTRDEVKALLPKLDLSGLLLSHRRTVPLFSEQQLRSLWLESAETQAFTLEYLFFEQPGLFHEAIDSGVAQGGIGPLAKELLSYFPEAQSEIDRPLTISLVRALVGVVEEEDLFRFNRWKSDHAAAMLTVVAGILAERNQPAAVDVFDIASNKQVKAAPEQALLDFVRAEAWNQRAKLIFPVAVILHPDIFPMETLAFAFDSFEAYSPRALFNTLLKTRNSRSIRLGLQRLGGQLPSAHIVPLLQHEDAQVRMEAIRSLSGRNDLSVLQEILAAYDAEKDPEVRRVYQQLHWVTKGR